jgi:hypothetical protein
MSAATDLIAAVDTFANAYTAAKATITNAANLQPVDNAIARRLVFLGAGRFAAPIGRPTPAGTGGTVTATELTEVVTRLVV